MRKLIYLYLLLLATGYAALAQPATVTGKISNEKGEAVPFATVKVKGSKTSVAANAEGFFEIRASHGQTLIISATNYTSAEVPADGDPLAITLHVLASSLSEVVVTALGQTQSKAKVGYSTTTFNNAAITKNAPVGMLDGLQGKVAGVEISNLGGPGASTKVILRGYGVIAGGSNQPLYVIDGVPLSDGQYQNTLALTNTTDFGNGMNDINPNDIESITILKGTAASSLYGGLARNGAIMITTKKGRAGKLNIEYNGSANFSRVGKLPDFQSEFGQGWGGVFVLSENGSWGPRLDGQPRLWGSIVDNSQLEKPFSFIRNNVRDFYETGVETNNGISLSGGNDVSKFYFSYSNVNSNGVVPTKADDLQRNTFSLRTSSKFNGFSINSSFNYINRRLSVPSGGQPGSNGGGVFLNVLEIPVDIPIRDFKDYKNKFFDINSFFSPYAENPYFTLAENGDVQNEDRFFGNVNTDYKFSASLSASIRLGGDFTNARTKDWRQVAYPNAGSWNAGGNVEGFVRAPDVGSVTQANDYNGIINGDFIVKYNKDLNQTFALDALAGANFYQNTISTQAVEVTNLTVPGFFDLSNTSLPPTIIQGALNGTLGTNRIQQRRIGAYAQATLSYKDIIFLTGNIRNDFSSTLPISNNSILYPGGNLSWLASQLLNARSIVSFLKFRVAYGRTGSDPLPYLIYPSLGPGTIPLPFGNLQTPFNGVNGFGISNIISNPTLKPVFTDEFEVGTEMKLFQDRIGIDAAVYDKNTKGQIFPITIAPSSGYTNLEQNLGVVNNRGIELTLVLKPVMTQHFSWTINYTYSRNWNKVVSLTGGTQNPEIFGLVGGAELRAVVGKTAASIYAPVAQRAPDGRIVVDANTGFPSVNQTPLDQFGLKNGYYGSGLYNYLMGLGNTLTYKNISLSFSLDFRFGGMMFSNTASQVLFVGNGIGSTYNDRKPFIVPNSVNAIVDASGKTTYVENKTFVGAGTVSNGSRGYGQNDNTFGYYIPSQNTGSAYGQEIFDRSFLKLRDINLSFSLPRQWISRVKAISASVGVYARNILLWTPKANAYVDPEGTNLTNDLAGELGEFSAAPISRSYGFILKFIF